MIQPPFDSIFNDFDLSGAINYDHPANAKLRGHWLALPGLFGGETFVNLVGKDHGVLTLGPTWSVKDQRPGGWGSMACDGTDDFALVSTMSPLPRLPITTSAWVYLNAGPQTRSYMSCDNATNIGWKHGDSAASNCITFALSGVATYLFTTLTPATGWNFVAYSLPGNGLPMTAWLKAPTGALKSETQTIGTESATLATRITLGKSTAAFLNGRIDDIRVNRTALGNLVPEIYAESVQGYPTILNRVSSQRTFMMGTTAAGFSTALFRENAGVGTIGGGPFARANAGLGAIA